MRDGIITLTCDPKYPFPSGTGVSLWEKDKGWTYKYLGDHIDKIVCPSMLVKKIEYDDFIEAHLIDMLKSIYNLDDFDKYNIFYLKKISHQSCGK